MTPEPTDPNSGRMTFLTAIIAVATVINIGVFWYESEDSSKKIETLSDKAGEIVGTMNTALSNNQDAISKAFDANRKAMESSERQSKAGLTAAISDFRQEQRAWIGPKSATLTEDIAIGKPLLVDINYRDTGREPALDVHPIYRFRSVPKAAFDNNTFNSIIERDAICGNLREAPGAGVVYPGPEGEILQFKSQDNWISADAVSGREAIVFEMCIAYKTVGQVHRTAFCYFYLSGLTNGRQLNICTAGNHAD